MATGKRNKEGRKRRKEQERVEYLDHQKRRLENYIKAEVSFPRFEGRIRPASSTVRRFISLFIIFSSRRLNVKMQI